MAVMEQKLRILYLMDIMLDRTDEEHVLNASQINSILEKEYGMSSDRRTIYSDLEILSTYGLDIIQKKGRGSGYYIGSRSFELPELKLLVDVVQASRFITEQKSRELIQKLEKLACRSDRAQLQKQVFIVNRSKAENETIYYNVDHIHNAIYMNREIAFRYGSWNMKKEFQMKKDGGEYVASPWVLTWNDDNYYLVAYDAAADRIKHYRVDRMKNIRILDTLRSGEDAFQNFDLAAYAKKTFRMFSGVDTQVSLICRKSMASVMIDHFGHDLWMIPLDDEHFKAVVTVSVSPQFFGWLAGLGSEVTIQSPENVRQDYLAHLRQILDNY